MAVKIIEHNSVSWTDVVQATPEEIEDLRARFRLSPIHLQDLRVTNQRPKLFESDGYLLLVLLFPVYHRTSREIVPTEVDFIIGRDFFITVHDGTLPALRELVTLASENQSVRLRLFGSNPINLLARCLDSLLEACNPMLDHMIRDIRLIENKIFNNAEREMVGDILISRRNITDFRRIMQAHKNILKKLILSADSRSYFSSAGQSFQFEQLIERTKEIWEHLASFKETIEALQQTNESLISHHLNVIMKNYTVVSVMIFAMTLVASLLALKISDTPLLHLRFGFWYILIVETAVATGLYFIFKHRRWI